MGPRTLLGILAPHPKPYLRMLVLKAVTAHINFLQALFIFYLLPSRQLSSQTLLIPGFDSLKQNVAKQQSFYNPHGWGRDALRVLSSAPLCKHTHVCLPRLQARPEGMPLDAIRCPESPHPRDQPDILTTTCGALPCSGLSQTLEYSLATLRGFNCNSFSILTTELPRPDFLSSGDMIAVKIAVCLVLKSTATLLVDSISCR